LAVTWEQSSEARGYYDSTCTLALLLVIEDGPALIG
jgi:hypothetical protein